MPHVATDPYSLVYSALSTYCTQKGIALRAEDATIRDETPEKAFIYSIISDNDTAHYDNAISRRQFVFQIDYHLENTSENAAGAYKDFMGAEYELIQAGFIPNGNMRRGKTAKTIYIQKDYDISIKGADLWD